MYYGDMPKTTLDQWEVLAAIVDHGGFAQAAEHLHRSQSAISYSMSRMEEILGLPLLAIAGRKAVLTEHGKTLLERSRSVLREFESLESLARNLQKGWEAELRLVVDAAFPRAYLLGIMAELQQLCPITQMQLSDAILSGADEAITDGSADVVVSNRIPAGFLGDWLTDINFLAVASPTHPLFAADHPLGTGDLSRHVQVVIRDSGTKRPRDDGWLGAERRYTVSSLDAALAITEAGLAFAWLPEHMVQQSLADGSLKALPLVSGGERPVPLHLVLVRPELAGPAARMALECFQRHLPRTQVTQPQESA